MFNTMIDPKMNGTVTSVRNAIGSAPVELMPIDIASAAPASAISVHTDSEHRLLHDAGKSVSGHRSKQSTRNMTASAVT